MSDIADKIYAATGLTLNAEAAAKIGHMIRLARQAALEEAARVVEGMSKVFHPSQVITDRCAAAIRALGEKE
jgi:hypothetical protein